MRHVEAATNQSSTVPKVVLSLLAVVLAYVVTSLPILAVAVTRESIQNRGLDATNFTPEGLELAPPAFLALILLPFAAGLGALSLCQRFLHQRPFAELLHAPYNSLRWNRMWRAMLLWSVLLVAGEGIGYWLSPKDYKLTFVFQDFLPVAMVILCFIPLQILFEEVLLRGYLLQHLSKWGHSPAVAIVLTSTTFGVLHFSNPEVAVFGLAPMATYYIGVGLFLALLTVLDDGLELALGVHLATNLFVTLGVGFEGAALPTFPVISTSSVDVRLMLILFVVQALTFFAAFAKTSSWQLEALFRFAQPPHNDSAQ